MEAEKIIDEVLDYIEDTEDKNRLRIDLQRMVNGPGPLIDLNLADLETCYQNRELPEGKVFRRKIINEMQDEQIIQEMKSWVESLEQKMSGVVLGLMGDISLFDVDKFVSPLAEMVGKDVDILFSASYESESKTEIYVIAM